MIDLHSHLLPGIDDGAPDIDVAVKMLDAYVGNGFRTVATTPHLMQRLDQRCHQAVQDAFAQVEPHARERGISLVRGFEIRLMPDVPSQLIAGDRIGLEDTDTVLVDLPFTDWPLYADDTLFGVQTTGHRIILAHPERYPAIQDDPEKASDLVARGIILQVTIGSFSGAFGKRAKRSAETLLEHGLVHLLATDAHSAGHRMAAVPSGMARLRELLTPDQLHQLTVEAPACLLNGEAVPAPVQPATRSWRDRFSLLRR
jgi:protein-tyrosine phosphatase